MDQITSKEKILKKVRLALNFKQKNPYLNIDLDSNVFAPLPNNESLVESFARNFTSHDGLFIACDNQFDFIDKLLTLIEQRRWKFMFCWEDDLQKKLKDVTIPFVERKEQLEKIQASITSCEAAIARSGSVLVSSAKNSRVLTIWPPVHIVVAYKSQVVSDVKDAFTIIRNNYGRNSPSMLSFVTGPSRTTDIPTDRPIDESNIVIGAQGPSEMILFLIDDSKKD